MNVRFPAKVGARRLTVFVPAPGSSRKRPLRVGVEDDVGAAPEQFPIITSFAFIVSPTSLPVVLNTAAEPGSVVDGL